MDWSLFNRFQEVASHEIGPRLLPALAEVIVDYLQADGCCIVQERDESMAAPLLEYPTASGAILFDPEQLGSLTQEKPFFFQDHFTARRPLRPLLGKFGQIAGLRLDNYSLKGWIVIGWCTPRSLDGIPLEASLQLFADKVLVNYLSLQRIALEQQYRFLFATVPQAIVRINENDNTSWVNQAALDLLQLEPDNLYPSAAEVSQGMMRLRSEAINQQEVNRRAGELIQNPNAEISNWLWAFPDRALSVLSRPIRSPYFNGRIWLFNDVSELYRSNQQLADQQNELLSKNDQLQAANREIESLISVIAHDLKSPLATLSFVLNFITMSGELNEQQLENVQYGQKTVTKGMNLIESIVYYNRLISRDEDVQLMEVELNDLLAIVVDGFRGAAMQKNIELALNTTASSPILRTDPESLVRVLDNLISNALKFSDFGKKVQIDAYVHHESLIVSVQDQGPGISPEDRPKLFKRFQRLTAQPTNNENSSGLGLSIVKALTEKIGAQIAVESELGQGTTFQIVFPAHLFNLSPAPESAERQT
ncbi:sensor histidine kinase [Rudanella lutea]|uniref:sensor histidine kinase n=1 Tax=Rudanella lutea TaxID=451374 RepID=UPI00036802C8|nr:PAS domain-containing sensor histidine kinase [Rudanella lutea]